MHALAVTHFRVTVVWNGASYRRAEVFRYTSAGVCLLGSVCLGFFFGCFLFFCGVFQPATAHRVPIPFAILSQKKHTRFTQMRQGANREVVTFNTTAQILMRP